MSLADKRKLECGSICIRNPFSVCNYPNAKPGTDLFWGNSNKCLDVKPDPVDFLFQQEMTERLRRFKLELHPEKTRLIEFGRFAADNRKERGEGTPETFNFLGFTHMCGKTRKGKFTVLRQTIQKKMQRKLQELKVELRKRMHWAIPEVGKWLKVVLLGHYRYYGVPNNTRKLSAFRYHLRCLWALVLRRRSQRQRMTWYRVERIALRWLPLPRIYHTYPSKRLRVNT